MNKKLIVNTLSIFVIYLTISGSSGYTDGEIVYQDNINIKASSHQSRVIELDSSFDTNVSNQGFTMSIELNITTHLDMVILNNESAKIYDNFDDYNDKDFGIAILGNLSEYNQESIEFSYPLYQLNSTDDDPLKFLIVIYNQGNDTVKVDLNISYLSTITVLDTNDEVYFDTSFLILSIISLIIVKFRFNKKQKCV